MKQKFYICRHCGNIVAMIREKGVPIMCCGEKMHEMKPGTTEASGEKHIPVYAHRRERGYNFIEYSINVETLPQSSAHYNILKLYEEDKRKCRNM